MAFVPPHDRVLEHSTSNSQSVFTVTGAVDTSYNAFSASMSIGDTTIGGVVEPGVAFKSGILTYSNTNEITVTTVFESKGTFSAGGAKQVFMAQPAKGPIIIAPPAGSVQQALTSNGTLPSLGSSAASFNLHEFNLTNPGYTVSSSTVDAYGGLPSTNTIKAFYNAAGGSGINSAVWGAAKATAAVANLTGVIGSSFADGFTDTNLGMWGVIGFTNVGPTGYVGATIAVDGESVIATGGKADRRVGVAASSQTSVKGLLLDAAFAVADGGAVGAAPYDTHGPWKNGFVLSRILYGNQGPPLSTDGTVFWADTAFTTANYSDMSLVTFTGNLFNFSNYFMDASGSVVFGGGSGSLSAGDVTSLLPIHIAKTASAAFQVRPPGGLSTFQVDTSGAGATGTGIYVFGQAAGSGARIITTSSASNEKLLVDAKGTGLIDIGSVSTGGVRLGNAGGGVAIVGTATNDNAAAGVVGEYLDTSTGTNNANATVTMTIATPCVVTWTGHGFTVGPATTAIKFTTTGALPTGVTAGTTYYVKAIDANTFNIATSVDNALAGTFIATSGSQSGVQTGDIRVSMASGTRQDVAGIRLAAGDYDISAQMLKGAGGTTTVTYLAGNITTTSGALDRTFGRRLSFQYGGLVLGATEFTVFSFPSVRFSLATATTLYLVADDSFGTSTLTSSGWFRAGRRR